MENNFYAVIMAGGKGVRFWPLGRKDYPKQLLPLVSSDSMLQETVKRLSGLVDNDKIIIMTNADIAGEVIKQLPQLPEENIIVEPQGRDTAPCIALAAAKIYQRDPEAVMFVLPADHVITPVEVLQDTLRKSAKIAGQGYLLTLGIPVSYPATGYGYIRIGETIDGGFYHVAEFKEKPDAATAEEFFKSGKFRWNSGMFVWQVSAIIGEFARYQPEMYSIIQGWLDGVDYRTNFVTMPKISIDYAIFEHTDKAAVGEAPFVWNDIGSWNALKEIKNADENGNVLDENVYTIEAKNNLVLSDDKDCAIGIIGLDNIAVIKSGNGFLVCALKDEQKVKNLTQQLPEKYL
ncbi:MAG: mannose-1-phosphate guanylyltransferase [Lentisphaerae bacterium]|nr:mannose-1-phosphate guanylyltransferase [Lentisphaerota bacterium]